MSTPGEQELEALLQEASPYLDDQGFTERVMQALPERRASPAPQAVLAAAAVAGAAVISLGPGRALLAALMAGSWSTLAIVAGSLAVLAGTAVSAVLREAEG